MGWGGGWAGGWGGDAGGRARARQTSQGAVVVLQWVGALPRACACVLRARETLLLLLPPLGPCPWQRCSVVATQHGTAQHGRSRCPAGAEGMSFMMTWLRLSSMRQLDW